jgi:hypothetical protein
MTGWSRRGEDDQGGGDVRPESERRTSNSANVAPDCTVKYQKTGRYRRQIDLG